MTDSGDVDQEIGACADCPFYYMEVHRDYDRDECVAGPFALDSLGTPPENCPLREGAVTVRLKAGA